MKRKTASKLPEPVTYSLEYVNDIVTMVPSTHRIVQNLMSGRDVVQAKDTPLCCDISSETYWSM